MESKVKYSNYLLKVLSISLFLSLLVTFVIVVAYSITHIDYVNVHCFINTPVTIESRRALFCDEPLVIPRAILNGIVLPTIIFIIPTIYLLFVNSNLSKLSGKSKYILKILVGALGVFSIRIIFILYWIILLLMGGFFGAPEREAWILIILFIIHTLFVVGLTVIYIVSMLRSEVRKYYFDRK